MSIDQLLAPTRKALCCDGLIAWHSQLAIRYYSNCPTIKSNSEGMPLSALHSLPMLSRRFTWRKLCAQLQSTCCFVMTASGMLCSTGVFVAITKASLHCLCVSLCQAKNQRRHSYWRAQYWPAKSIHGSTGASAPSSPPAQCAVHTTVQFNWITARKQVKDVRFVLPSPL